MKARPPFVSALPLVISLLVVLLAGGVLFSAAWAHPGPSAVPAVTAPFGDADDIADPATTDDAKNVELVGRLGGLTYAVAVQGDYAYVGEGYSLTVLDVSNSAWPTIVGKTPPLPAIVRDVYVVGDYAYVADWSGGLRVIDVSNPVSPTEVGLYDTPGSAYGVTVAGNHAYIADSGSGLRVVDVSNPISPTEVGFYDTPGPVSYTHLTLPTN